MKIRSILTLTILSFVIACPGFGKEKPYHTPPPIPQRLIERIQKTGHPFLLSTRDRFRETSRLLRQQLLSERGQEFKERVPGYFDEKSPWFLGQGPFGKSNEFHPLLLSGDDKRIYAKIAVELMAYTGMQKSNWAIERLKDETLRLLGEIQPARRVDSIRLPQPALSERQAYLLALCAMMYDIVYQRFDTIDRHDPNRRIKQVRDRLAAYCASVPPEDIPVKQRIVYGSALGVSTLFCISIHRQDRKDRNAFSVQTMLPDLYRAVSLTSHGLSHLVDDGKRLAFSLQELEWVLPVAIPWIECMKRLGYPFDIQQGAYVQLLGVLESHRVPGSSFAVFPATNFPLRDPWIPRSNPLFWSIDERMYPQKTPKIEGIKLPGSDREPDESTEEGFGVPNKVKEEKPNPLLSRNAVSLADQLRYLSLPRRNTSSAQSLQNERSSSNAGWQAPAGLETPSLWGALYLLAQQDDPLCQGGRLWEELAMETDSHPYTYLFYKDYPPGDRKPGKQTSLIHYPNLRSSVLSSHTRFGDYVFAIQSATGTVLSATSIVDHESFMLADHSKEWRWFHAVPSATDSQPAITSAKKTIRSTTPILTELYSCWTTDSPNGRTLALRRHISGVGGGYTAVAHFPEAAQPGHDMTSVVFSMPNPSNFIESEEGPGQFTIAPAEAPELNTVGFSAVSKVEKLMSKEPLETLVAGTLNAVFSPGSIKKPVAFEGELGRTVEVELTNAANPFFYLLSIGQTGRENFDVKYDSTPVPGLRIIEWKEGIELLAINQGDGIKNDFVDSDADFVVVTRNRTMKALYYMMVNGTYLRCKFSPTQKTYLLLADTKGKRLSVAWSARRLFTSIPSRAMSVFYAPGLLGFDCPGYVINYGQKKQRIVVWGYDDASSAKRTGRVRYRPLDSKN